MPSSASPAGLAPSPPSRRTRRRRSGKSSIAAGPVRPARRGQAETSGVRMRCVRQRRSGRLRRRRAGRG
eukprot:15135462-Alexandrium_andersonii.AAC.1